MWNNLAALFASSPRARDERETRERWCRTEAAWRSSPLARETFTDVVIAIVKEGLGETWTRIARPVFVELCVTTEALLLMEEIGEIEPVWERIEGDLTVGVAFRTMVARRERWAVSFEKMLAIFSAPLARGIADVAGHLPEPCFERWSREDSDVLGVPLVEMLAHPALVVERLVLLPYTDDTLTFDVYRALREQLEINLRVASGCLPTADISELQHKGKIVVPTAQKHKSPAELARLYLAGTPFERFLELPVPFEVPEQSRFEHCHIIGGTGHGKTQLMQRLIHADLVRAAEDGNSVIVIDSQGDLISKLSRLALFDPDTPGSLADRLILIDPSDVEFPASLNLFDAHLGRLAGYRPVDRERVLNGVIELYDVFFGAMLGAELTQKQGVIFRYLARLMMAIPDATIHTLMQLMEDGRPFTEHMAGLDGSARYFFETEFFHPSFAATKKQILKRLWGVLATPAFERMFAQTRNKLDLFEAMNEGKIILISTAKDLLKTEGSALFGRFFVAMIAQAALERSILPPDERTSCFVYIDEAQEYFDDAVETILVQARKYRVGLTLAHQTLDQLAPRLRSAILANTSLKCVGGVSAKDARALADELHTFTDFIESMRRGEERTEFAMWLKNRTPQAIRVSVPLGHLERQPILTEEAFEALIARNRERYCGTQADVLGFAPVRRPAAQEPPPRARHEEPAARHGLTAADASPEPIRSETSPRSSATPRPSPPRKEPPELGKGGSQHKYVQHLVKELAEARGFRAVIEEPAQGGQVDVALHREGLSIACEISVTSKTEHEVEHIERCLAEGYARVFVIAIGEKRLKAIEALARARIPADGFARLDFLTPEHVALRLDAYKAPVEETTTVHGYKVKVSRSPISAEEMQDRRAAMGRVIAQSMRDMRKGSS